MSARAEAPSTRAAFALLVAASCGGSSGAVAPDAAAAGDGPGSDASVPVDATTDGPAGSIEGGPEASATNDDASPAGAGGALESGVPIGEAGVDSGDAQSTGSEVFVACPGPLGPATATSLKAGGAVDPAMSWLYPYSGTVFPAGLQGPILQWVPRAGGTAAASGPRWILFSLPNFHFHAVTAYDILRSRGVPIGKRDYEGRLRTRVG